MNKPTRPKKTAAEFAIQGPTAVILHRLLLKKAYRNVPKERSGASK